ncbi:pantothenate kinase [Pseudomonas sp. CCI1.2]|uniref:pantothenate kinase n=1 Tax=unclassified Pseudomonas TaxID=196821 RepID=UPI002AC916C7|nr:MULTISPECIES: pantothenate kinase [unclassified Pseudomonas]MEB0093168.1 pantothenate kinase [Pseudomonas sp. CCI4.2]MEB0122883.1 pantothenate kinase [Pseudomonas sp. CCI1.2]WPX55605.1 pantothenate kinase [Pseudomonas sp. CCI4.2]
MILELDCGNSFIKWRVVLLDGAGVVAGGVVDSDAALLQAIQAVKGLSLLGCRLVSVRTDEETEYLIAALSSAFSVKIISAVPTMRMAGVTNGYEEYERLGLDRWLALVGAFHLAAGACLVVDLGTAITSDFVSPDGQHLGGFICPGVPLMRSQLTTHTRRIRYSDDIAHAALASFTPGRSTAEAVERGCSLMLQGFVLTQLDMAKKYWGERFSVFVTGGDAILVKDILPFARVMPDLVFVGLALACPLN